MPTDSSGKIRLSLILHGAWAIPGLIASYVFAIATGGHPPGIVFLPLVLIVWALGHLGIWGASRVADHGARRRGVGTRLPVSIAAALVGTGIMSMAGAFLALSAAISGDGLWSATETTLFAAVWLVHVAAFVGLLDRTVWGRIAAALAAVGWLCMVGVQVGDHLIRRRPVDALEMGLALALIAVLTLLAHRLLAGRAERERTSGLTPGDTIPSDETAQDGES